MTKKLLIGCLVSLVLLFAIESLFWLAATVLSADWRVDPLPSPPDYEVICSSSEGRLTLCPDRGPQYERVRPEIFYKQALGPRIITIGESFVYGLGLEASESWPAQLQQQIGGVEVLNFGRCGTYASRLLPIFKAAVDLSPELIILSTGNNEHTMTSFYAGPAGRHPMTMYKVSKWFGRSQLYGALFRLIAKGEVRFQESFTEIPKQYSNPSDKLAYAARRRPPDLSMFTDSLAPKAVTAILEEEQRLKEMIFRDHLLEMIALASDANIPLLLTTLPRDFLAPPVLSGLYDESESSVRKALKMLEHRDPNKSTTSVDDGLTLAPQNAHLLYERGMIELANGNEKSAIEWIEQSNSWDLVPDATPEINEIIRQLASQHDLKNWLILSDFPKPIFVNQMPYFWTRCILMRRVLSLLLRKFLKR